MAASLQGELSSQYPGFVSVEVQSANCRFYRFSQQTDASRFYNTIQHASVRFPNANITFRNSPIAEGLFAVEVTLVDDRIQFARIEQIMQQIISSMEI